MPSLHDPVTIGDLTLKNRILMAPLTRTRASGPGRVPNALMSEYYAQRASAGLILTEATTVTAMGVGYPRTPGIWSDEQVEGWRLTTSAVHAKGGTILLQLWHVGRISDPVYLDGALPVAPSALPAPGHVSLVRPEKPHETPRALETAEIPAIVEAFRRGAENAKKAGFDGVEIHGANGYLVEQFLASSSNHRTDAYGGSLENRARFMLEITDAVLSVWSPGRVGMHLSPRGDGQSCPDANPTETFTHIATELGKRRLAFLCTRESQDTPCLAPTLKKAFGGALIANQGLTQESGQALLDEGSADAIAYGKLFIANPDLPARFAQSTPLNPWNGATFYAPGPEGYTDYPALTA
jgi:hypothetical protein